MNRAGEDAIESLFHAALALPADQRGDLLSARCPDPAVRAEVEQLLRYADGPTVIDRLSGSRPPVIPRFRIIDVLGEGGFGVVYRAEQLEPFRRIVAIKVARWSSTRSRHMERFAQEMRILARLDHPAIARLFETGTTSDGRPFITMECISGTPITMYCRSRELPTRLIVELFTRVCDAVHHAHQHGVIHRDLKPANILVAETDGNAVPKVIDFGVAKWLLHNGDPGFTLGGDLIGTPAYMSPEQARQSGTDVRTDVFALGAILYELLVGITPLDAIRGSESSVAGLLARAREPQFLPASVVLSRRIPRRPAVQLRGDLDAILDKALQAAPADRYASVSEFAADLRRYLADEPVLAKGVTTRTAIRRFVRRNRLGVAVSAATLATLLLGLAGTSAGLVRAWRESASARAQCDLLVDTLIRADPLARGTAATVRDLLDAASAHLSGSESTISPELVAKMRAVLGRSYAGLGLYDEARQELRFALDIPLDDTVMPPHLRAGALCDYADACRQREQWDECERALAEAFTLVPGRSVADRIERARLLRSRSHLRAALQQLDAALVDSAAALHETIDIRECSAALRLHCQTWHGTLLRTRERFSESETVIRAALASAEQTQGRMHPQTAMIMTDLADTLLFSGRAAEAEELARRALDVRNSALGQAHPHTINSLVTLAACCAELGSFDEAARLRERALELRSAINGSDSEPAAVVQYLAGLEALDRGDYADAIQRLAMRIHCLESRPGPPSIALATTRTVYAAALILAGDADGAVAQLDDIHRSWPRAALNASVQILMDACSLATAGGGKDSGDDERAIQIARCARATPMLPSRQRIILRLLHLTAHSESERRSRDSAADSDYPPPHPDGLTAAPNSISAERERISVHPGAPH